MIKPHPSFPRSRPGEILAEAIEAMDISKTKLAERLGVTRAALYAVLDGTAAVSTKMALALEREVGSSAEVWLGLQADYDLWIARGHGPQKARMKAALGRYAQSGPARAKIDLVGGRSAVAQLSREASSGAYRTGRMHTIKRMPQKPGKSR